MKLVRVVCDGPRPFVAGIIIDPDTERAVIAAPILRRFLGQHQDTLRQGFKRLGWRATIVRRASQTQTNSGQISG